MISQHWISLFFHPSICFTEQEYTQTFPPFFPLHSNRGRHLINNLIFFLPTILFSSVFFCPGGNGALRKSPHKFMECRLFLKRKTAKIFLKKRDGKVGSGGQIKDECPSSTVWNITSGLDTETNTHFVNTSSLTQLPLLYTVSFFLYCFFFGRCGCVSSFGSLLSKHAQLFHLFPSSVLLQCDQQKRVREAMSEHNTGKEAFPPPQTRSSHSISNLISDCFFFLKECTAKI